MRYEYTKKEITNPIIKKANQLLKENGLAEYDSEFINDIESLEYIYDIDLNKIPLFILNKDKLIGAKYFINNLDVLQFTQKIGLLNGKEAIELANQIIKELSD